MKYHICQSVEGALKNWGISEWKSIYRSNNCTVKQAKKAFKEYLAEGKRVIPIGYCDNFSYVDGCMGHPESF